MIGWGKLPLCPQAKVILGMDPAQSLDDVTIQTIHAVFTAKLQEVSQAINSI